MTDLTPNPAREKWELNKETAERAHKSSDKFILEGNKAVLTNAETVVRSLILINGGAAISVMTFVGALAARPSVPGDQISAIARGLEWFAGGALAAVLTAAFAYLTNYLYMSTEQKKTRDYERPYLHENEASNRRLFRGTVCHYLAVAFVVRLRRRHGNLSPSPNSSASGPRSDAAKLTEDRSRPDEIGVLGLQPVAAFAALVEGARPLRHHDLKAKLAGLGEHDHAPRWPALR
jgi:hypothetical protein